MVRADELILISETQPRGEFDSDGETERTVFCTVRSVGMNEAYQAASQGINPEYVFVLANYDEYEDEKLCEYNGTRYKVIRTYVSGDSIEITVEKAVG